MERKESNSKNPLLKDLLFNEEKLSLIITSIKSAYEKLNIANFKKDILLKLTDFELKDRITWVTKILKKHMPGDFKKAADILLNSMKFIQQEGEFIFMVFPEYIETYGCEKTYLELSLQCLGEFTKLCSSEFAIRSFINRFPDVTFNKLIQWSRSHNVHQRRLASEGLRPKLPWAKSINMDYKKAAAPLEYLYTDSDRYVTRSVANHLNDISKFDLDFVLLKLKQWKNSGKQKPKEMEYIINHSLRTAIKRGDKKCLEFLGYSNNPKINIHEFKLNKNTISLGEKLEFEFYLSANSHEKLIVDYKIHYPNPKNKKSEKVFKISKIEIKKGESRFLNKKHLFRKMTTKRLYPGNYGIEIQINGKIFKTAEFTLKT